MPNIQRAEHIFELVGVPGILVLRVILIRRGREVEAKPVYRRAAGAGLRLCPPPGAERDEATGCIRIRRAHGLFVCVTRKRRQELLRIAGCSSANAFHFAAVRSLETVPALSNRPCA